MHYLIIIQFVLSLTFLATPFGCIRMLPRFGSKIDKQNYHWTITLQAHFYYDAMLDYNSWQLEVQDKGVNSILSPRWEKD